MADLDKVRSGQPFHPGADDWNGFIDAAKAHHSSLLNLHADPDLFHQSPVIVQVKNETGKLLPRMSVAGVYQSVHLPKVDLDQFKNEIVLRGRIPEERDLGRFVILRDHLPVCWFIDFRLVKLAGTMPPE